MRNSTGDKALARSCDVTKPFANADNVPRGRSRRPEVLVFVQKRSDRSRGDRKIQNISEADSIRYVEEKFGRKVE